jgi:outer membrane protein assembly factor BamB
MSISMPQTVAVVPIFVNAGTALLPAIVAPLASVLALLLRPRELMLALRRKPSLVLMLAGGIAVIWLGAAWAMGRHQGPALRETSAAIKTDWAKVAVEIIRREQMGQVTTRPATTQKARDAATVFRHDFSRCGHDGGPAPADLKLLWEFNEDGTMFLSSPTVVGDRVYGASCTMDPIAGNYGMIFCLDAASGKPIWKTLKAEGEYLKPFFSSPAITADGKYLVIGQGLHDDADCHLICLEAERGSLHWRIKTPLHIEGSPAIMGDMVVAGAGAIEGPDRKPTTDPGYVLAVRISDGKELWRYRVNDPESSPAISKDGIVYIGSGFQGNAVAALRSETDEELKKKGLDRLLWKTATEYPATGAVTLAEDVVLVCGGNGDYVVSDPNPGGMVTALDAKTGKKRWERRMDDAVLGAVAVRGKRVICGVKTGELVAMDLADGNVIWRQRTGNAPVAAAPALAGRYAYGVSKDGYLVILDADDGRLIKRYYVNDESGAATMGLALSSPTIAGGCVFVGSETGGLRCFAGKVAQ